MYFTYYAHVWLEIDGTPSVYRGQSGPLISIWIPSKHHTAREQSKTRSALNFFFSLYITRFLLFAFYLSSDPVPTAAYYFVRKYEKKLRY